MNRTKSQLKVVTKPSTELAALVDEFLETYQTRGLSPKSRDIASNTLTRLVLPWAAKNGLASAADLNQTAIDAFSRHLQQEHKTHMTGKPLSPDSVRTYMRTLKTFVRWAQQQGEFGGVKVPMPKAHERVLEVLSVKEMRAIEKAAPSKRDSLIIRLLADTGMRLGELLGLRRDDLMKERDGRTTNTFVRIREGKGGKVRTVPIPPDLYARLKDYSERPEAREAITNKLFTTDRRRKDGQYGALTGRSVQQLVKYAAMRAGVERRVHPHAFRHAALTRMVNQGMPVDHIRRIAGHADLDLIVKTYSHVRPTDLYNSYLDMLRREEDSQD